MTWEQLKKEEQEKDYFKNLSIFIEKEYKTKKIYPEYKDLYKAIELTPYETVKVVIIGQDPYHGEFQANGLSFSVKETIKNPPSLINIFKELESDLGIKKENGNLENWAKEGVLLLNSILTVEANKPSSHRNKGWETFTNRIISELNKKETPIVFILWGNYAKTKKVLITNEKHYIIESTHPSPFSAYNGFFGSKPFSKTNEYLIKNNIKSINW